MEKSQSIKMVLYQHRRKDTNNVFYVGIGSSPLRAYKKSGRNKHWHNVVNKYGYDVEFIFTELNKESACSLEMTLIKFYGRCCDK